jgi:hypothetical protein
MLYISEGALLTAFRVATKLRSPPPGALVDGDHHEKQDISYWGIMEFPQLPFTIPIDLFERPTESLESKKIKLAYRGSHGLCSLQKCL